MASKHAKLKLALTRAIIDFFLQEDLYADELKIQGTVCVTADRSAIFVTQITETVNEGFSADAGPSVYTSDVPLNHYRPSEDCPEDLTCKSVLQSRFPEKTPPLAHTKTHQPSAAIHKNSPFGKHSINLHHSPNGGAQNKHEWSQHQPSNIGNAFCGDYSLRDAGQDLTSTGCPTYNTSSLTSGRIPLLEGEDRSNNQLLTLNSAILNAAAKSAIERLTSLNRDREREKSKNLPISREWAGGKDTTEGNIGTKCSLDSQGDIAKHDKESVLHDVIDCSSAKKRRLDNSSVHRVGQQPLEKPSGVNNSDIDEGKNGLNSGDLAQDASCEEPLMLVTPKRERISDDECDPERDNEKSNLSATSTELGIKTTPPGGLDLSPASDSSRKQVSPSDVNAQGGSGSNAPWTFTVATMKEEPGTLVTEWSSADWMRKPRTKFSQEQLQALELEYKNDPFLSTSADKRAGLARRLKITEKNVQIWFQNQRRRRRAAAYSQMHYTINDTKTSNYNNNGGEEPTDPAPASPDIVSDHDETIQFGSNTEENNVDSKSKEKDDEAGDENEDDREGPGKESIGDGEEAADEEEPDEVARPGSSCSLGDSISSELVIATDFSAPAEAEVEAGDEGGEEGDGDGETEESRSPPDASQTPERSGDDKDKESGTPERKLRPSKQKNKRGSEGGHSSPETIKSGESS